MGCDSLESCRGLHVEWYLDLIRCLKIKGTDRSMYSVLYMVS